MSGEHESAEEPTAEATAEEQIRWALEDHIETLKVELWRAKQREQDMRRDISGLVNQLRKGRRWF